jgi:hypothetical protein
MSTIAKSFLRRYRKEIPDGWKLTFSQNDNIISIVVTKDEQNRAKLFKILADLGEEFTIEELIKMSEFEFGIYQVAKRSFSDFIKMV